jgi:hypothetical protein
MMMREGKRGANLSEALSRVTSRPWLIVALAAVNVGLSIVLSSPLSAMLAMLIDRRPAAAVMVSGADHGYTVELLMDHPELTSVAAVALGAGVLLYGSLSWILTGGVLAALALDGERRAASGAEVVAESARRSGRMIKIGLLGLPLRIVPMLFGGIAYGIMHAVVTGRTYQPVSMVAMLSLVVAAVVWVLISVALDYARGLSLDDAQTRSWRLVARGLKLALARRTATLQLIAFSLAAWLAVGVIYFGIAGSVQLLLVLTVLRLACVAARATITMTTMTAAARVARS